jgi:spermidine synthase
MSLFAIFTVIVIGLSGMAGQVLILRELLVSFYGNELTLGVILASWLAAEALGVFSIGRLIEKIKNKAALFVFLEIVFSISLPLSIYLSRTFKSSLGLIFGEGIGLAAIFCSAFFIMFAPGFSHGALFSAACKIFSLKEKKESACGIGKVYTFETAGTILGGVILTYIFIPLLDTFQNVFIISAANLVICLFFLKLITNRRLRYAILILNALSLLLFLVIAPSALERRSLNRQFKTSRVLAYRNSVYGNIAVTQNQSQRTFFYNGIPIITTPYPDTTFVEEFAHIALLTHPVSRDILIISSGAGGLINEVLKHPVNKVDYAELDPLLIKMLQKYPSDLTARELNDPRVNIINTDARFFLKNTTHKYDLIMLGISKPVDLTTNRFFTEEFFSLARDRLNNNGILEFALPGSSVYISSEIRDLNFCILNALKKPFPQVRIIPGDYNLILASGGADILEADAARLSQRIEKNNIQTKVLNPAYLNYRLDPQKAEWFRRSTALAGSKSNKDFTPLALFQMLLFWNALFSPKAAPIFQSLGNINLLMLFGVICLVTLGLIILSFFKNKIFKKIAIFYSLVTTGFYAMLVSLILIFSYQIFYGYLINRIGLLIAVFMAGTALGSAVVTRGLERKNYDFRLFIRLEFWIIIFCSILAVALRPGGNPGFGLATFSFLFFISGAFVGFQFPLANKLFLKGKGGAGAASGILYFADLLGGLLAGVFAGIIFLPVLGLFATCLLVILVKTSSFFLLLLSDS